MVVAFDCISCDMVRVWYLSCDAASSSRGAERVLFVHMYMYRGMPRCAPGWLGTESEREVHPFRVEEGVGLFLGCRAIGVWFGCTVSAPALNTRCHTGIGTGTGPVPRPGRSR